MAGAGAVRAEFAMDTPERKTPPPRPPPPPPPHTSASGDGPSPPAAAATLQNQSTDPVAGDGFLRRLIPAGLSALRRNRRSVWVPRAIGLAIALCVFAAISLVRTFGGLEFLELKAYDLLVRLQPKDATVSPQVVVLGMTEPDLQALGFPMPDEAMARLLRLVLSGGPSAVGVDIYRDIPVGPGRAELMEVLADRRVVSCMKYGQGGVFVGAPPGVRPAQVGFVDIPTDGDGRVRRALLFFRDAAGKNYQAMSMRLATRHLRSLDPSLKLGPVPGAPDTWFRLGRADYRPLGPGDGAYAGVDASGTQVMVDFRGATRFPPLPISDVLNGKVPPEFFSGKVVLLGVTTESVKDYVSTSLVSDQYGVELHAVRVDQLVRGGLKGHVPAAVWPGWAEHAWALGWTLLGCALGLFARQPLRFALLLAAGVVALLAVVYGAFVAGGLWLPALPGLVGCVAAAGFVTQYVSHHERAERTVLNELFKRMVSQDVADTLWQRRDELFEEGRLAAREVRATVLFTDLQGFTTISEAMDKACLMTWLNRYMTEMSDLVERHGGFVNKYVGDAVMAVFGPPLERTAAESRQDAVAAVECALAMRASLAARRLDWTRECADGIRKKLRETATTTSTDWRPDIEHDSSLRDLELNMRVGVYTGPVVAGSLGSAQRLEYTVIGDTVNTAARLESYDKSVMGPDIAADGCRILIGQSTLDCLDGKYATREVGSIMLKGKRSMVTIHGVIGRAGPPGPARRDAAAVAVAGAAHSGVPQTTRPTAVAP